jgi:hypothetical protein
MSPLMTSRTAASSVCRLADFGTKPSATCAGARRAVCASSADDSTITGNSGAGASERRERAESVQSWQNHIEDDDVEVRALLNERKALRGIPSFEHDRVRAELPKQRAEPVPNDRVIIDDQNLHRRTSTPTVWS